MARYFHFPASNDQVAFYRSLDSMRPPAANKSL
jgi:hypothetical protein